MIDKGKKVADTKRGIKILMIEDDLEFAEILSEFLQSYHIDVKVVDDPFIALSTVNIEPFDLILLDLTLPGMDGLEVCKKIVEKHPIPIIISSARGDTSDKVTGLQLGADDYLPKPYDPKELYARILTVLRRYKKEEEQSEVPKKASAFRVERDEHLIYLGGKPLSLTNAEYDVLAYMLDKHGFAISRDEMIDNIDAISIDSSYKSIDVLIGRIRNKIGDTSKEQKYIQSVRGIGYKAVG